MNAYKEMLKGIEWVLENRTSYRVAKDLGINARTINRYQNGETPIENMSLGTAEKIYNYYKERKVMEINNVVVENADELEKFLDERLKAECYDIEEYLKEIIESAHEGNGTYELSKHETKSGNTVDIHYKYDYSYDEEFEEISNEVITIL